MERERIFSLFATLWIGAIESGLLGKAFSLLFSLLGRAGMTFFACFLWKGCGETFLWLVSFSLFWFLFVFLSFAAAVGESLVLKGINMRLLA